MIPQFGVARQYTNLKDELLDVTDKVLSSGILIGGTYTQQFETWLAEKNKCEHAITVHSGTQALEFIAEYHSRFLFSGTSPKVRVPNLTYQATLNAFLRNGWEVELGDTDHNGILIPTDKDPYTPYDCVVGLYGAYPEETNRISTIIDGAQHWLANPGANIAYGMAISFDPTKNLNAPGNGGAVVTNDQYLRDYVREAKNNGKKFTNVAGTNSKMSELDCAHLLVKSRYIDAWQERRKKIRLYYLKEFENTLFRCLSRGFEYHADQKFVIYTEHRDALHKHLIRSGIESKIHYPYALSELPISEKLEKPTMISTSVMLSKGVLSLPIYPELTDSEVETVVSKVKKFMENPNLT